MKFFAIFFNNKNEVIEVQEYPTAQAREKALVGVMDNLKLANFTYQTLDQ